MPPSTSFEIACSASRSVLFCVCASMIISARMIVMPDEIIVAS